MVMKLDQVVPFGRSLREYELMFDLSESDKQQRILGCGDGPASFNAEMTAKGHSVISLDPLYDFTAEQIQQRFEANIDNVIAQVDANPDCWVWSYHRNSADLKYNRSQVMAAFVNDFAQGLNANRYMSGSLPNLPFADQAFELALCSHFLFLYSDLFSIDFHIESILELCRVAKEVRIFPLLTLDHKTSDYLEPIQALLTEQGIDHQVQTVAYELQKGGNQMLRLRSAQP